jgi:hypothetical protein
LKPANILLTPRTDAAPGDLDFLPRLTDFGLAKLLGGTDDSPTVSGAVLGTAPYMAPEQAAGSKIEVTPAVDVYGLGAILYELLTGRPPFRAETPLATLRQVAEAEVLPPGRLRKGLPKDLETITLHCLRKLPAERYTSAAELAADLERYLDGLSIQARRPGLGQRSWRWCHRNARALVATLLVALGLLLVIGLDRANRTDPGAPTSTGPAISRKVLREVHSIPWQGNHIYCTAFSPDGRLWLAAGDAAAVRLYDVMTGELLQHWEHRGKSVGMAAFLPGGKQVLSADEVGILRRWDVVTGKEVGKIEESSEVICGLAISPDGHRVLLGGSANVLRLVNLDTGAEVRRMPGHTEAILHVAMSTDGRLGLSSSNDKTVRLWNLETGTQLLRFEGHRDAVFGAYFLPGDRHVLSFSRCDAVIIWDRNDGRILRRLEMPELADKGGVAVTPDGKYFVASQQHGPMVALHDLATGQKLDSVRAARPVRGLSFSPDGRYCAGGTWRGYAYLWEIADAP